MDYLDFVDFLDYYFERKDQKLQDRTDGSKRFNLAKNFKKNYRY